MGDAKERAFRSNSDGQLGYLCEHEDSNGNMRKMIRLDRAAEKIYRPYHENQWTEERSRPLSSMQLARITYEADRALRMALGEAQLAVPEWLARKDEARIDWRDNGPPEGTQRRDLYEAIRGCLTEKE